MSCEIRKTVTKHTNAKSVTLRMITGSFRVVLLNLSDEILGVRKEVGMAVCTQEVLRFFDFKVIHHGRLRKTKRKEI